MITNEELTKVVIAYNDKDLPKPLMRQVFIKLATFTYEHKSYYFECDNPKEVIDGAADLCLEKVQKYDAERGKAFNFFTTIIGCYLRQMKRCYR
jgi:hypothetical protein